MHRADPVFVVRLQAPQHDVGPKAPHVHRGVAGWRQPCVEFGQRSAAGHQQAKTVGELRDGLAPTGPLQAAQAAHLGVETRQAQTFQTSRRVRPQEVAEPLRRHVAHVVGVHRVVPHPHAQRRLGRVQRQVQRQHARRAQHQLAQFERGLDQRHARQFALGDEIALGVHHHPGPVVGQSRLGELGLGERNAGTGLDRVDPELFDGGLDIGGRGGVDHGGTQGCRGGKGIALPSPGQIVPCS